MIWWSYKLFLWLVLHTSLNYYTHSMLYCMYSMHILRSEIYTKCERQSIPDMTPRVMDEIIPCSIGSLSIVWEAADATDRGRPGKTRQTFPQNACKQQAHLRCYMQLKAMSVSGRTCKSRWSWSTSQPLAALVCETGLGPRLFRILSQQEKDQNK